MVLWHVLSSSSFGPSITDWFLRAIIGGLPPPWPLGTRILGKPSLTSQPIVFFKLFTLRDLNKTGFFPKNTKLRGFEGPWRTKCQGRFLSWRVFFTNKQNCKPDLVSLEACRVDLAVAAPEVGVALPVVMAVWGWEVCLCSTCLEGPPWWEPGDPWHPSWASLPRWGLQRYLHLHNSIQFKVVLKYLK